MKNMDFEMFYECFYCNKQIYDKKQLVVHIKKHCLKNLEVCWKCSKRYRNLKGLTNHLIRFHTELITEKQCSKCGESFKYHTHLNAHVKIHGDATPFACVYCCRSFSSSGSLKLHINLHTRQYRCNYCAKSFYTQNRLMSHLNSHVREKRFCCDYCPKVFYENSQLTHHIRHAHLKIKPTRLHPCCYCKKSFSTKRCLNLHLHVHKKPISSHYCAYCCRTFSSKSHYSNHFRMHNDEQLCFCNCCISRTNMLLKTTNSIESFPKDSTPRIKSFFCATCGKSFIFCKNLICHIKKCPRASTTRTKSFFCATCGKSFIYCKNLICHIKKCPRVSTKRIKTFFCAICGKGFVFCKNLIYHIKKCC